MEKLNQFVQKEKEKKGGWQMRVLELVKWSEGQWEALEALEALEDLEEKENWINQSINQSLKFITKVFVEHPWLHWVC